MDQTSLLLNWTYFHQQQKSTDEARQSLLLTMELEEELKMRDAEIAQLRDFLSRAILERDQAQEKCQRAVFEKLLLQQRLHHYSNPHSGISSIDDDPRKVLDSNNGFSSSDCDESIVSSPHQLPPMPAEAERERERERELPDLATDRPLPEKGQFLQAVMKAGPLLQTLLLAGPLPEWRHPPPPLDNYQIPPPPVVVPPSEAFRDQCGAVNRKRGAPENSDCSNLGVTCQRIVLQ